MNMSVGERDKTMSEMAGIAAAAFCDKHTPPSVSNAHIKDNPEMYLEHTVPYITVRTLHRHEKALKSLEADSRWIKRLTIVLAFYPFRLDTVIHSLQSNASPTPSPTATTVTP